MMRLNEGARGEQEFCRKKSEVLLALRLAGLHSDEAGSLCRTSESDFRLTFDATGVEIHLHELIYSDHEIELSSLKKLANDDIEENTMIGLT